MPCNKERHDDCCDCCPVRSFRALGQALERMRDGMGMFSSAKEIPYRCYIPPAGFWRPGTMPAVGS